MLITKGFLLTKKAAWSRIQVLFKDEVFEWHPHLKFFYQNMSGNPAKDT